jgi:hypothetical protein
VEEKEKGCNVVEGEEKVYIVVEREGQGEIHRPIVGVRSSCPRAIHPFFDPRFLERSARCGMFLGQTLLRRC